MLTTRLALNADELALQLLLLLAMLVNVLMAAMTASIDTGLTMICAHAKGEKNK